MDSVYICMPAYNEECNIEKVVTEWYEKLTGKNVKSRLVIADSGSTDSTHQILIGLSSKLPQLVILSDTEKIHGPKVISLYNYAIENGADYVFQTDSDGQTNPDEFDAFWEKRTEYEAIIGNRTVRQDGKDRAFVENVVVFLLKLYFKISVPDANAPFRLMKSDLLKKYLSKLPHDYFLPNIMLTTFFQYYHEKISFEVISFKPRAGGENSINFLKILKIGIKALGDFRHFKRDMLKDEGRCR